MPAARLVTVAQVRATAEADRLHRKLSKVAEIDITDRR
jgi:hypothetical protein